MPKSDDQKRDEILERMLNTPHVSKIKPEPKKANRRESK
jgi:hypothetical protein